MPAYAMWLMPRGEVFDHFACAIQDLARKYGGPVFEPHVTLLGGMTGEHDHIYDTAVRLAHSLRPFTVQLAGPAYGDTYFQCVYFNVMPTSNLMDARIQGSTLWNQKISKPYEPHLSLIYGLHSQRTKRLIMRELPQDIPSAFKVTKLHIIQIGSRDPKDWKKEVTYPLRKGN